MALPTSKLRPGAPSRQVDPANWAFEVTPDDNNDITNDDGEACVSRALFVGVGGDVTVVMAGEIVTKTFKNVPDGAILPIAVRRVMSTGTLAEDILALW